MFQKLSSLSLLGALMASVLLFKVDAPITAADDPSNQPPARQRSAGTKRNQAAPLKPAVSTWAPILGGRIAALPAEDLLIDEPADAAPAATAARLPIVEYHYSYFSMGDGVSMKPEWFDDQLRWLSGNGFKTLTAEELVAFVEGAYAPPQRSVVLTFDVGGSKFDDYENVVVPALRKYGFHAIFFVLASRTLDECDGENACWPALAGWQKEGVISVGSHSWSHIDYAAMPPEQIALDAGRSKKLIEEKIGQPVLGICYPFDSPNPAAFSILEALGYKFAVGGYTRHDRSVALGDLEPYNLPRYYPYSGEDFYPIIGGTGGLTFEEMMLGAIK